MAGEPAREQLLELTGKIVTSYLSNPNHDVALEDIKEVIQNVYAALEEAARAIPAETAQPKQALKPAVPVDKSVTPNFIICLEDGKKLKMLKRYLKTNYSMTPEQYRKRWGLPSNYPMVAPSYAMQRSTLAKKIGLGTNKKKRQHAA